MTALADSPQTVDEPPKVAFTLPVPVATLSVDLMPEEIVVKRRLGYLKRRLVFVVAAFVALVVLGDLLVRQQTNSAQDDLGSVNAQAASLTKQVNSFNGLLAIQGETQTLWTQLAGVMGDDVAWPQLIAKVTSLAPAGVHASSLTTQVNDPSSSTGTAAATQSPLGLNATGALTLTGTAPNWHAVATYVQSLSATKGFTAVNPSTVSKGTDKGSGLTFTITLDLTADALSNRYTKLASNPPGTSATPPTAKPADDVTPATTQSSSNTAPKPTTGKRPAHSAKHTSRSPGAKTTHRTKSAPGAFAGGNSSSNQTGTEAN